MSKIKIIDEYNENKELYGNLQNKIVVLIKELLFENVNYHNISSRVKEQNSLEKKINIKDGKYSSINEITDIVGCRIISYFEDDVQKIVESIRKEFDIDEENSVNKKAILESDKFGYLSYHLVCSISPNRLSLPEYKKYENIKFEIQIRSILQHAWAEIEHDIGYKSSFEIPKELKRKFSRIAGLLETADESFCEIKKSINEYEAKIKSNEEELFQTDLNLNSLILFTKESDTVLGLDKYIANINSDNLDIEIDTDSLSLNLDRISFFNLKTIKELKDLLKSKKSIIERFAKEFLSRDINKGTFPRGISYFYLVYILCLELNDLEIQKVYFRKLHLPDSLLTELKKIYDKICA